MTLCGDDHKEICYEGRYCPACEIRKEKDSEISELKDKIADLLAEITDLSEQVTGGR